MNFNTPTSSVGYAFSLPTSLFVYPPNQFINLADLTTFNAILTPFAYNLYTIFAQNNNFLSYKILCDFTLINIIANDIYIIYALSTHILKFISNFNVYSHPSISF